MGRKNMCTVTVRTDTCVIRSSVCNELRTIPIVNVQVKIMCVQKFKKIMGNHYAKWRYD